MKKTQIPNPGGPSDKALGANASRFRVWLGRGAAMAPLRLAEGGDL